MELKRIIAYDDKKFKFNMDHFYGDLMYLQKLLVTK